MRHYKAKLLRSVWMSGTCESGGYLESGATVSAQHPDDHNPIRIFHGTREGKINRDEVDDYLEEIADQT